MADQSHGLTITCAQARELTELRLAATSTSAVQSASMALGFDLATIANCWSASPTINARLAPNIWLLQGGPSPTELSSRLGTILHHASDLSHSMTSWALEGHRLAAILSLSCGLDFREASFPPGTVTRTLFANVPAIISRTQPQAITLHADRSHAHYINNWLADARLAP